MPTSVLLLPRTEVPPLLAHVDAWGAEEHAVDVERTDYPVESGATLTDHAVVQPRQLVLKGWTSAVMPDSRFGRGGRTSVEAAGGASPAMRGREAWAHVQRLIDDLEPVEVVSTVLGDYDHMLVVAASATVDETTGRSLDVTLTLREVQLGTVTDTPAAVSDPGPVIADRVESSTRGLVDLEETPATDRMSRLRALGG